VTKGESEKIRREAERRREGEKERRREGEKERRRD